MGGGNAFPPEGGAAATANSTAPTAPIPELDVLITGFGPFPDGQGGYYEKNASHEITRLMPASLHPSHHLNASSVHINIVNPTAGDKAYIKTEYAEMRKRIKELHAEYAQTVDLFVHLGQAGGWHWVTVERRAYKEGMSSTWWGDSAEEAYYTGPDDAGQSIGDLGPCPWESVPIGLHTALNVDAVVEGANKALRNHHRHSEAAGDAEDDELAAEKDKEHKRHRKPIDVIPHQEPGNYGCGFSYYESMANCFVQMRKRDVLFCHVPAEVDEENLEKARDGVLAIIGAAVGELVKRKAEERESAEAKLEKLVI